MFSLKNTLLFLFALLLVPAFSQSTKRFTISGYVTEKGSKENLPGVNIFAVKPRMGATTNAYGFYSITLPADSIDLTFSYSGYQTTYLKINLDTSMQLDVTLDHQSQLQEVVVSADKQEHISEEIQISKIDLSIEQLKNIPALLGEKDVLKTLQLLPGVQKGSEGSSGIYVRGGGPDQNLIILDDATVYNATHLFGFFSLFNGDALKSVELTKGGFPAKYGGRLSSVIDMQMKDGDKEKLHGEVGIGLISSRFTLEGPIKKNKASFLISGRRTYIDLLTKPLLRKRDFQAGYFFYDVNAKLNYILNYKNKIYVSTYFGKDKFNLKTIAEDGNSDPVKNNSHINWGNATATLRWNHLINDKMFSNVSLIFTDFLFDIGFEGITKNNVTTLNYFSGIRDYSVKADLDFYPNAKHAIKTGIVGTYHYFRPNAVVLNDASTNTNLSRVTYIETYETALYIEDDYKISEKWRTKTGIRLSNFNVRTKSYFNPEPRVSLKYAIKKDFSIKASYSRMNQYLHLLSNSGIGLPSDLWVPATDRIKPQVSNQVALGLAKDLKIKELSFLISLEGYYKTSDHIIGYKEGASFLSVGNLNPTSASQFTYEDIVTTGKAESYGAEFFFQKKSGRLTGWIGYTLSWTWLTFDELNFGKRFPARYDRRHDISIVGTYKLNDHITLSATWVYGTGNAVTLPMATYQLPYVPSAYQQTPSASAILHGYSAYLNNSTTMNYYGERNSVRIPAYHRLDIGIQFNKKRKKYERTFELGIYNVYNRSNPFFYTTKTDYQAKTVKLVQVSLFPIIPSVSWIWKF